MDYLFSPSDIDRMSKWTSENLRELRRRHLLSGYGRMGDNGRWSYSTDDLLAFFLAQKFFDAGIDQYTAFKEGRAHSEAVSRMVITSEPDAERFPVLLHSGPDMGRRHETYSSLRTIEERANAGVVIVLDLWAIARGLQSENPELHSLIVKNARLEGEND